jgi:polysaccharide deacetylase 2 family uncharacterized protein YibQ
MALAYRKKSPKPPSGSRVAAWVILLIIITAVIGYYWLTPRSKTVEKPQKSAMENVVKPKMPERAAVPQTVLSSASPALLSTKKDQHNYPLNPLASEAEKLAPDGSRSSRLAIIVDDMGNSLPEARSLAAIKVPLTFAIIPGLRFDTQVATFAASQNIETLIHIPMQSKGWPTRRLESNGLLVSMDNDELQERVSAFIQRFPAAVGVNNHMGSEFTEQEEKMSAVLNVLKKHNIFYIDSVTSSESIGLRVAERLGVRTARRNVFLDNEQERGYILGQLAQAVRIARKNGTAIAICHPHPATIAALALSLPGLAGQGVRLVPVSQLVK